MKAFAPGRVNIIGDHTDYTGGVVLPMAIDRGTTVEGATSAARVVRLSSDNQPDEAIVSLTVNDPASIEPSWARFVAGVIAEQRPAEGFAGSVKSTLPIGAGLSSSSSLTVAVALALGFSGTARELALACQRAETMASGVPGGVMDQLTSAAGVAGHALFIDCTTLSVDPVRLPAEIEVVVVHSGVRRSLAASAYAERRAQCEAAERAMGVPLREATAVEVARLHDGVLRRRARHVIGENERVRAVARAFAVGDIATIGEAVAASHASLRDDFDVSTPELDALVQRLTRTPGVIGARLTGAGFGGCVVALVHAGSKVEGWRVHAAGAAYVER